MSIHPAATMLTFSGLGAYTDPNPSDGTAPITFVDISSPSTPGQKELRVVVGPQFLTGSRVCDPDFTIVQQPAFGCP